MSRRELDALRRNQVKERIVGGRHRLVHRRHHRLVGLWPRHGEESGIGGADLLGLRAHAAGDDHAAVLGHRLADRGQRLGLGRIKEAAGVDDDDVGTVVPTG